MKKIVLLVLLLSFSQVSFASKGHKSKGKKLPGMKDCKVLHMCKEKKSDAKIACLADRLSCSDHNWKLKLNHLSSKSKKKNFAKIKSKHIEKLSKKVNKSQERLGEVTKKLAELKSSAAGAKRDQKIKMKAARIEHLNKKIDLLNGYKTKIEALK